MVAGHTGSDLSYVRRKTSGEIWAHCDINEVVETREIFIKNHPADHSYHWIEILYG